MVSDVTHNHTVVPTKQLWHKKEQIFKNYSVFYNSLMGCCGVWHCMWQRSVTFHADTYT